MGASAPTFTSSIYIYIHACFVFILGSPAAVVGVPFLKSLCSGSLQKGSGIQADWVPSQLGDILRYADVGWPRAHLSPTMPRLSPTALCFICCFYYFVFLCFCLLLFFVGILLSSGLTSNTRPCWLDFDEAILNSLFLVFIIVFLFYVFLCFCLLSFYCWHPVVHI